MYILAIDQGTTGTTSILYDRAGRIAARAYCEITQHYPQPGWVEHDAMEIWQSVVATVEELCSQHAGNIAAIGITNQRETTLLWNQHTGQPVYNAIVWQCRRTAEFCQQLQDHTDFVRAHTGLPLDAYFSGTKIRWLLDNAGIDNADDLLFGTIDSWLIWRLTGGAVHATDYSNASRTLLFDIHERCWSKPLAELIGVPLSLLPEVRASIGDFGKVTSIPALKGIPILGVAGDQQAALFGQTCFQPGQTKNTYGTGGFVVMNTGQQAIQSKRGLLTTLAIDGSGAPCYAMEGSVFIAGAALQWLRDELRLITSATDSEMMAQAVDDNGGVYLVPAFVGLGTPHWNMQARATLTGMTRGTNRNHIVRAALEAMAYQTNDVIGLMEQESGKNIETLAVDGGACANNFLMQFQADILDRPLIRPQIIESTSLGTAYMAGLAAGLWEDTDKLTQMKLTDAEFQPGMPSSQRQRYLQGWQHAVRQCLTD
ncbi:Glycerol kinase [hydrothermal vent metagenome]|uniref:glycerol kinase n=1 Tax=hydrothermal vent metagenome TaxID=652676 RepID=A0A3B0YCN5_9ZZZZ